MTSFYLSKPYEPPQAPSKLPLGEPWALFGGISPDQFMARYWHKKPLLIRGAIPAFALSASNGEPLDSPIPTKELLKFALQDEVEARLVKSNPWSFDSGPFSKRAIPSIDKPDWKTNCSFSFIEGTVSNSVNRKLSDRTPHMYSVLGIMVALTIMMRGMPRNRVDSVYLPTRIGSNW